MSLLDPEFIKKLEYLSILSKKVFSGSLKGEHRSKKKGVSPEFADYRNYSVGDDLRYIDWNLYGRLEKLFLKLFLEEEDLYVYILLDTSASMDFGDPQKFTYGLKISAALGYIVLTNMDRLGFFAFSDDINVTLPPVRGKGQFIKLLHHLNNIKINKKTSLNESVKKFVLKIKKPGICILISDFLDEKGYEEAIKLLIYKKFDPFLIHILSPQEFEPEIHGNIKLVDIETGEGKELTINQEILSLYKKNLKHFITSIHDFCSARGIKHIVTSTEQPFDNLIMETLKKGELVK